MYTISVIPMSRGTAIEQLTYYSALEYPIGTVLSIPVRSKTVPGVVVHVSDVRVSKAQLRTSSFALRKLTRQAPVSVLSPEFVHAAQHTADWHATTAGAVFFGYVPKALLTQDEIPVNLHTSPRPHLRGFIVPRLYQGLFDHRIEFYRGAIREAFAARGSVLLMCPTTADVERVYTALEQGIERYAYILHSTLSAKKQKDTIAQILQSSHPIVVVCTPGFLSLPRQDLTTIIVEREGSSLYRGRSRPHVDVRILAHHLAAELGGQIFLADLPLRIESMYRKELGEYEEVVTGHHRMHWKTRVQVVSQKGEGRQPKKPFQAIGRELITRTHEILENNGRVFLYVARRGLSPVTLCADCGTTVICNECDATVVLHKGTEENHFLCHACGAIRHARERCKRCQSWRLETFGIGTELVHDEIATRLPGTNVSILSADTARSHTAAKKIIDAFYSTPRSVLVGTELALPHLHTHIPLVGVVSLDSLLSLASWNIYERIASTLTRLREAAGEELLLQTRHPEEDILAKVLAGNFSGFYRSELRMRKDMGYPPYTVLVKVSVTGKEEEVVRRMQEATTLLQPYELITYSRLLRAPAGKVLLHGFLRLPRATWPDPEVLQRLRSLSPQYSISINPDSVL